MQMIQEISRGGSGKNMLRKESQWSTTYTASNEIDAGHVIDA
jgi:hypothetical protein